jgi:hypothetical protein
LWNPQDLFAPDPLLLLFKKGLGCICKLILLDIRPEMCRPHRVKDNNVGLLLRY